MQTGGSKIEEFLAWEVINSCRGGGGCCFGSLLGTIFGDKAVSFMMASILCKNIATYFILIYTCHIWGSNVYNLQQRTLTLSLSLCNALQLCFQYCFTPYFCLSSVVLYAKECVSTVFHADAHCFFISFLLASACSTFQ